MADYSASQREAMAQKGQARPDGSFPVKNRADLENAIRAVGRVKGGESARRNVRRYLMRRAKALGLTSLIPDTWQSDGSLSN